MIDVWMIFTMLYPFTMVALHTVKAVVNRKTEIIKNGESFIKTSTFSAGVKVYNSNEESSTASYLCSRYV